MNIWVWPGRSQAGDPAGQREVGVGLQTPLSEQEVRTLRIPQQQGKRDRGSATWKALGRDERVRAASRCIDSTCVTIGGEWEVPKAAHQKEVAVISGTESAFKGFM